MKKILIGGLMAGLLAFTLAFALMSRQALGAATDKTQVSSDKKSAEPDDESSFWDLFRKTFSRPEPTYDKAGRNVTTVAGVRGVNNEGKLGNKSDFRQRQMDGGLQAAGGQGHAVFAIAQPRPL